MSLITFNLTCNTSVDRTSQQVIRASCKSYGASQGMERAFVNDCSEQRTERVRSEPPACTPCQERKLLCLQSAQSASSEELPPHALTTLH